MATSTAPTPLDESLEKFLGGSGAAPLAENQVTYGSELGYDPSAQFRPQGDILTINAEPGTGATTSETWAHELDIERQKQDQLEFEFQQQQEADRLAREAAELEMARAAESRAAGMYGYETESAKLANQAASTANQLSSYELMEAQRAEEKYQQSQATAAYNNAYAQFRGAGPSSGGAPITQQSGAQFAEATKGGYYPAGSTPVGTNLYFTQPMTYVQGPGLQGGYKPVGTMSVPLGLNGKPTQQIYNY